MTSSRIKSAIYRGVEELSAEACLEIARRSTSRPDADVINVTMNTLSDTPVGFLGDHYKVNILVRLRDKNQQAGGTTDSLEVPLFVKTKPRNAEHLQFLESLGAFEKERLFFTTILALLRKYTNEAEDPWLPKCFFTNHRLIVLEDLTQQGFKVLANRAVMDYDHLVEVLRVLARMHASSIVAEELEGRRLGRVYRLDEEFPKVFQEAFMTNAPGNPSCRQVKGVALKALLALTKLMPELRRGTPMLAEVLAWYLKDGLFDEVCGLVKKSTEFRNVVTHGDLWQNNIMFMYSNACRPVAVRLIDFQLVRYAPPAHDFLLALYFNTTRSLRRLHFTELAHVYHTSLTSFLAQHSLDADALLGWTQFEASLHRYRLLGLAMACLYFPMTLMPRDVAAQVFTDDESLVRFMLEDRSVAALKSFAEDEVYRARIGEVLEELAEFLVERAEETTS